MTGQLFAQTTIQTTPPLNRYTRGGTNERAAASGFDFRPQFVLFVFPLFDCDMFCGLYRNSIHAHP